MIPSQIIQFWDSEIPNDVAELMTTWKTVNNNYDYLLFNREQARQFIQNHYGNDIRGLFDKAKFPAMMSDIFRVAYCLAEGGVYIDAASQAKTPVKNIITKSSKLILMRKWHGAICNGFIAAQAGNQTLNEIWEKILFNVNNEISNNIWALTGPGVFTAVAEGNNSDCMIVDQVELMPVFDLVNDLKHKEKEHWSKRQEKESIFNR